MPDFSTPALHAIEAETEASGSSSAPALATLPLHDQFEIPSSIREILANNYQTVALQFPDELLGQSVLVYRALMVGLRKEGWEGWCYVLGDSTYGSCCPDILSCSHLPADLLIHYGHACLTPTDTLPVRYIFPKRPLDPSAAAKSLFSAAEGSWEEDASGTEIGGVKKLVVVIWDVSYDWLSDQITSTFTSPSNHPSGVALDIVMSKINKQANHSTSTKRIPSSGAIGGGCGCATPATESGERGCCSDEGRGSCSNGACTPTSTSLPPAPTQSEEPSPAPSSLRLIVLPEGRTMDEAVIFYIGDESRAMTNLMMENALNQFFQFSPSSQSTSPLHTFTPSLLRRRFFALSQALSASVFGLLVHNVGLQSSQALVGELRELLKKKGRKSYTISVGRLNPAKLGNFEVVECWVLVGCREGGLVDSKDYYRPIITPHELILALEGEKGVAKWDVGKWTLDFDRVLSDIPERINRPSHPSNQTILPDPTEDPTEASSEEDQDRPVFSLISGQYHQPAKYSDPAPEEGDGVVAVRGDWSLSRLEGAASKHLQTRSWVGLDPTEGYGDKEGEFEPAVLVDGRKGIARGYGEEEKHR